MKFAKFAYSKNLLFNFELNNFVIYINQYGHVYSSIQ